MSEDYFDNMLSDLNAKVADRIEAGNRKPLKDANVALALQYNLTKLRGAGGEALIQEDFSNVIGPVLFATQRSDDALAAVMKLSKLVFGPDAKLKWPHAALPT